MSKLNMEVISTGVALGVTTAIATDWIVLPYWIAASPYTAGILVLVSFLAFSVFPALGMTLFVLTAVILFKRNVQSAMFHAQASPTQQTVSNTNTPVAEERAPASYTTSQSMYGEESIATQASKDAYPYSTQSSQPRSYDQFQETDKSNPALGPLQEGFEPAPYGDEQGAPIDGFYPIGEQRASENPDLRTYAYRPDADTGSNAFQRDGPNLDEKAEGLRYS